MKKITILLGVFLFTITLSTLAQTFTFQFEKPQVQQTENGYSIILYENCINLGDEGLPEIPYQAIDLLLNQNQELINVKIISTDFYPVETGIKIKPAVKPVPVSKFNGKYVQAEEDQTVYASEKSYPASTIENLSTHFLNGHAIGSFTICPVEYIPAKQEVTFLKEITIQIETKSSKKAREASHLLRTSPGIERKITSVVENPNALDNYFYANTRDNDPYDLLIISNAALLPGFDDYVEYKVSVGFYVKTITVEDIYSQYTGQDDQEKIRNCIIDYYTNNGIGFVILAGDADPANPDDRIIPHRGFVALDDTDIPSDMYYSNLDGTWNDDGDNLWGEPAEADLYSEVSIGRICVDNPTEVENFLNKLTLYQNAPVVADVEKTLIIGESLNSTTWGGTYKDEIVNGSSANGYTTVGFPPNIIVTKLYEMLAMWNKSDVYNQFNNAGVNLMNHLGHSNVTYNMKMYNSDLTTSNFTNDGVTRGFVIGYSQGCYNGSFDNRGTGTSYGDDCFSEKFTTLETGEVACVTNSRYGWYNPGGTNSSSQYYDRLFFDAIFGKDISLIGDMNAESKEYDISYINNNSYWRWTAYELNLFGDPSMDVWTAPPTDIVADYPVSITIGSTQVSFDTDAPYARIAIVQDGELIGRGVADANGDVDVTFLTITNPAPLEISIIAHNKNRHLGSVLIISNQPYVVYESNQINDVLGNANGLIDYGESIYLSIGVTNVGDQPAYNTVITISTTDPYVTITDDNQNYGVIQAGQTVSVPDAFAFDVSADIPDEYEIAFDIVISGDDTWYADIELEAFAPVLSIGNIIIDDTVGGNANTNIDPGETIIVIIPSSNIGHSDCFEAEGVLSSTNQYITISEPSVFIGDMPNNSTNYVSFEVVVDDYAPIGDYVDISYSLSSGLYMEDISYSLTIGLIFESWESGDFSKFNWSTSSTWPWGIAQSGAQEGSYCVCSGDINNDETSNIMITYNCVSADDISFFRKISSEEEADYLRFYIDYELVDEWSGFLDWEEVACPVSAGVHTFMWQYEKNAEEKAGEDCSWIDYIVFPPTIVTACYPGPDTIICEGLTYQCDALAANFTALQWTTSGTGTYDDITILNPVYSPSEDDYEAGSVTLTLKAFSNLPCGDIVRNFILTFDPLPFTPVMPTGPDYVDLYYTTSSEYTIPVAPNADSYMWDLDPVAAGTISGTETNALVDWDLSFMGEAIISVKAVNECGESVFSEGFEVTVDNTVGLGNDPISLKINIIPNPNAGIFLLDITSPGEESYSLKIINTSGSVIFNEPHFIINKKYTRNFDIGNLNEGIYYLVLESNNVNIVRKLVIMK